MLSLFHADRLWCGAVDMLRYSYNVDSRLWQKCLVRQVRHTVEGAGKRCIITRFASDDDSLAAG